ncbi:recombinase family protein [Luxibacter massiliensis]|uniref:recombinase family protein n=1 Tax=Luxibacter massiliensis TaxID=2219695 RepID=UPI000F04F2D3|nr:recombinase family protein [Luxibacter massiliensis]
MKIVRMLLRVSSDQQLEADGDLGIQRQLVKEYIESHSDWKLDNKEYFEGSNSGYKNSVADRMVLQEAYKDAEQREYDILVAYKDDRIGRRMWEIGSYIMSLKTLGVDIYTVKDGLISPESSDMMGQMMLALRYGNAQKSSADTGMRVRDTAKKLVVQGKFMGGKAPYGYTLELSGEISKHGRALKHLVIVPEHAEVVRKIYHLSLNKEFGSAKIARTLNEDEHYKNLAPNDVWKSGTITSILTNPIYAGYTAYNRRESLNGKFHQLDSENWTIAKERNNDIAIVDESEWNQVQYTRKQRGNKYIKKLEHQDVTVITRNDGLLPLVDVIYCGYCGCKLVNGTKYNYWTIQSTGEKRASKIATYKCQNAWQGIPHDKTRQFRADWIEPIVFQSISEYIGKLQEYEDVFSKIQENHQKEKLIKEKSLYREKSELEKIRKNICVMEENIPLSMTGEYPLSLEELVKLIKKEKQKEEEQLKIISQREREIMNLDITVNDWEDIRDSIPTWQKILTNADNTTKRVLVNKLIERIDVTKEEVKIRFKINLDFFLTQPRMNNNGVVSEQRL